MFKCNLKQIFISLAASLLVVIMPPVVGLAYGTAGVVEGNNQFAFELFNRINYVEGDKNIFISPVSLSTALGITYAGSRGTTAKQMADTMHFTLPQTEMQQGFSSLLAAFGSDGKSYQLKLANALWGQEKYRFDPDFVSLIDNSYGGGFRTVDFINNREVSRQTINSWVAEKTADKIQELLLADDLSMDTKLVLTNAVYFKGAWTAPFKQEQTLLNHPFQIRPGEMVAVPMMWQTSEFRYAMTKEAQLVELPYEGDELSMVVLLPNSTLEELAGSLAPELVRSWLEQLKPEGLTVFLPKFKIEARYYLEEQKFLPAMGIIDAFSKRDADFSGMTGHNDLYIAHVIHQAVIEVNEAGSEATGATAVVMDSKSAMSIFRADKPFLFMIMHKPTGSILFMGKVNNPVG